METAKIFNNGGSQAIRLPKSRRFTDDEVLVKKVYGIVMLMPKTDKWKSLRDSLNLFTDDFLSEEIEPLPLEEKEVFL